MSNSTVFTRLYLPRPLEASAVTVLLTRLAGGDVPRPVVFELHASAEGIVTILGCAPRATSRLKRLLRAGVPGLRFGPATRPHVAAVSRVAARPGGLPLGAPEPETLVAQLYDALAARRGDEVLSMQIVLGASRRPSTVRSNASDPTQPFASLLMDGVRQVSPDVRRRLAEHAGQVRFDTAVRIGVTAESVKRRTTLLWGVFGGLQSMESPGVRLSLLKDSSTRWQAATLGPGAKLRLTPGELMPLLAWPLGGRDYPGVQGAHPRILPVPEVISRTDSVFALGTAPGPARPVGIDPFSRLQHAVVLGPTGSGKSTLLEHLIHSDIAAGRACCVIEPKSQLIDRILATAPPEMADRIVMLDATDTEIPVGFNPLDCGDRDPDIVVDGILAALAAVFSDSWGPRTEYLTQGALLSLARAGQVRGEPYTLIDLPRIFTDDALRRPIVAAVQDDFTLAAFWEEFEAMRPAQRAAVIASPLNKLRKIVMRKPLVAVLGQASPRFRLRDVFRERKVVLVPLNDALLGTGASRLLGSLIVAELWMATLERAQEKEPMKRPGMIFIDEVQNYLHLPTPIDDVLATSRSYGVGWHLAHQYRKQLPDKLRAALDVNARSKICFALDPDDARDLAKQAPQLTAEDFQALDKHHIYTRLVAGGRPVDWCSALASPPLPETGHANRIRETSRRLYGADLESLKPTTAGKATSTPAASSHQKARRS